MSDLCLSNFVYGISPNRIALMRLVRVCMGASDPLFYNSISNFFYAEVCLQFI
jgi:hypothetical protein